MSLIFGMAIIFYPLFELQDLSVFLRDNIYE